MYERKGYGRIVDKLVHDTKYYDVANTLNAVLAEKAYDKLRIYAHLKGIEAEVSKGLKLISEDSLDLSGDYLNERDRAWLPDDWKYYMQEVLRLLEMMVNRKAKNSELKEILSLLGL